MFEITGLHYKTGNFALQDIHLKMAEGSYFVLVGESGSGKSILLELIAGFYIPQSGIISVNGKAIQQLKIQSRPVGILFQDYALFPHLTVYQNIAYSLKAKRYNRHLIKQRVTALASRMNIAHLLPRAVQSLSGGERQRTALARALALQPAILLLDEPLSSVDASMKKEIMSLLRQIHKDGQTIIHVTHDYEEALALATHVGVLHQGKLLQYGTPEEVFHYPKSKFVAQLTGEQNFYEVNPVEIPGSELKEASLGTFKVKFYTSNLSAKGYMMIPHKNIIISGQPDKVNTLNHFEGTIHEIFPSRFGKEVIVDAGIKLHVAVTRELYEQSCFAPGMKVWVSFKASSVKFFPVL